MSSLSTFPVEILEWITSMVFTSQQMRLWLCGDRILNIKLKNGGLKRTSLCWSSSSWMPCPRWYFTTFNSLQDVEWDVSIGTSYCPTLELNLLPKTLKRLHLACTDVFVLLRKQNVNMNELLPLLHSLRLSGSRLRVENLKNLPSNLIELNVTSCEEKISSANIFRDLPRTIQRLKFAFDIIDESEHENDLPSELISFAVIRLEANFKWLRKLPQSLKSLYISYHRFEVDWSTLPNQLEKLGLDSNSYTYALNKSDLPQLPHTLKTLKLWHIAGVVRDHQMIPFLPKNLTKLRITYGGDISHSGLQQLPSNLSDLDVNIDTSHPDILSFFHPDTIRIRLGPGACSERLNVLPFPTKLEYLRIHFLNDDMCSMLPHGLRTLRIDTGLLTIKGTSNFPKSLTSLLAFFESFDSNEALSKIAFIPDLDLRVKGETSQVTENWISSLLPSVSIPASSDQNLESDSTNENTSNPLLKSLAIHAATSSYLRDSFFRPALAKFTNLNTVFISYYAGISPDWLGFLPRSMTDLKIHSLNAFPTAAQLSSLPNRLRSLDLDFDKRHLEYTWSDEMLQSLPRSLHIFKISRSFLNLTHRIYEYLPPNLQETTLNYGATASPFVTPLDRLYELDQ